MIKGVSMATELAIDNLKNGTIYTQDSVDELIVLRSALDVLQYSLTLTQEEKENVITNARVTLAGVTGYIHGAKGI